LDEANKFGLSIEGFGLHKGEKQERFRTRIAKPLFKRALEKIPEKAKDLKNWIDARVV